MSKNSRQDKAQAAGLKQQRNEEIEIEIAADNTANLDPDKLSAIQQEELRIKKDFEKGEAIEAAHERKVEEAKEKAEEAVHHQHTEYKQHVTSESVPGTVKSNTEVQRHNEIVPDATPGKIQGKGRGEGVRVA